MTTLMLMNSPRLPATGWRPRFAPRTLGLRLWAIPAAFLVLLSSRLAQAQSVDRDLWITNGAVNATASLGDTLYVGGSFTRLHPVTGGGMPVDLTTGLAVA